MTTALMPGVFGAEAYVEFFDDDNEWLAIALEVPRVRLSGMKAHKCIDLVDECTSTIDLDLRHEWELIRFFLEGR